MVFSFAGTAEEFLYVLRGVGRVSWVRVLDDLFCGGLDGQGVPWRSTQEKI